MSTPGKADAGQNKHHMKANEKALSDALFVALAREDQICERPVPGLSPPPYFCDPGQDFPLSNDETCLATQS